MRSALKSVTRRSFLAGIGPCIAGVTASIRPIPVLAKTHPVKVGAILPLSGPLQLYGEQARLGIDMAMAEINEAGGFLGRQLEVVYADNRADNEDSRKVAEKFTKDDDILAVIGPITSSARDIIDPITRVHRVPLLYATNYEGGVCSP